MNDYKLSCFRIRCKCVFFKACPTGKCRAETITQESPLLINEFYRKQISVLLLLMAPCVCYCYCDPQKRSNSNYLSHFHLVSGLFNSAVIPLGLADHKSVIFIGLHHCALCNALQLTASTKRSTAVFSSDLSL
jgi:hypothetical protein